jgi:MFS transporter, NNP family, nitrate/nitrite transporter
MTTTSLLTDWRPEDAAFWDATGARVARRNLWISIPALVLAFVVWMVWSVVVVNLPAVGFTYTSDQLFWLAALPGLSGSVLRVFYSFLVSMIGGRRWTAISTASLAIPAAGIGFAVQDPTTPYSVMVLLAVLCGLGGGNFASSMANISFFFPKATKGNALALNAGLGNLGVSVVQFVVPLAITTAVFGGAPQALRSGGMVWLQNAGFVWLPFILVSTLSAWFGMNDIASAKSSFREQAVIFRRADTWLMSWLYIGTFGSFIGVSAAFPLLAKTVFPAVNVMPFVFLGPLVGAVTRAATGWVSDRWGGARVTHWVFIVMILATLGIVGVLGVKDQGYAFPVFFALFLVLFAATGVGNASTFQMIPGIFREVVRRGLPEADDATVRLAAERESAAVIGFSSALGAFGAFFVPKSYGTSLALTGGAEAALYVFVLFYVSCLLINWLRYMTNVKSRP